jgi:hypothetical protein
MWKTSSRSSGRAESTLVFPFVARNSGRFTAVARDEPAAAALDIAEAAIAVELELEEPPAR